MVVAASAVLVMVSAGIRTVTVAVQPGSVPPAGQLFPAAAEVRVLVRDLSPVSGLLTVTVKVMVAAGAGGQVAGPGQVRGW